jgi:hypothetical protein
MPQKSGVNKATANELQPSALLSLSHGGGEMARFRVSKEEFCQMVHSHTDGRHGPSRCAVAGPSHFHVTRIRTLGPYMDIQDKFGDF